MAAGTLSAIAGGGTFVSLPPLMHAGPSSTPANASSTIGMLPGSLVSEVEFGRGELKSPRHDSLLTLTAVSFAGSLAGVLLLVVTSSKITVFIRPWLLLGEPRR